MSRILYGIIYDAMYSMVMCFYSGLSRRLEEPTSRASGPPGARGVCGSCVHLPAPGRPRFTVLASACVLVCLPQTIDAPAPD